jgi:hypothetical protein
MSTAIDWPTDGEWIMCPTDEELEHEQAYWDAMDRIAEYDTYVEMQANLEDFSTWPIDDLIEELETVRILTPDQENVIEELVAEIERRRAA